MQKIQKKLVNIYIYTQKSGKKKVHFLLFQADEFRLGGLTYPTSRVAGKFFVVWAGYTTCPNQPKTDFRFQFPS